MSTFLKLPIPSKTKLMKDYDDTPSKLMDSSNKRFLNTIISSNNTLNSAEHLLSFWFPDLHACVRIYLSGPLV